MIQFPLQSGQSFCNCERPSQAVGAAPFWATPWDSPITWAVQSAPPGVTVDQLRQVTADCLAQWAKYANFTYIEKPEDPAPDILVRGWTGGFDEQMASASIHCDGFIPPDTLDLNNGIAWGMGNGLIHIILHELGHCLGLDHSVEGTVMWGYYSEITILQPDDIASIQALYGAQPPGPNSMQGTFLGITGEDYVGQGSQSTPDGHPDWHLQLTNVKSDPASVTIVADNNGRWTVPYNGSDWIIYKQFSAGTLDLWFSTFTVPNSFAVTVKYADGSVEQVAGIPYSGGPTPPPPPPPPTQHTLVVTWQGTTPPVVTVDGVVK